MGYFKSSKYYIEKCVGKGVHYAERKLPISFADDKLDCRLHGLGHPVFLDAIHPI